MLHEILDLNHGELSVYQARHLAEMAKRDERTIWRWRNNYLVAQQETRESEERSEPAQAPAADGGEQKAADSDVARTVLDDLLEIGPDAFRFDDTIMALMYLLGGHQSRLHAELVAAGYPMPSVATVSRRWAKVSPMQRDGAKFGLANKASKLLHIRHSAERPNDVWQFDAFNLDMYVRPPYGTTPLRPWVIITQDDHSRFITGSTVLTHQLRSDDVLAAWGSAFDVRPADNGTGLLIGGYPGRFTFDNESVIRSRVNREALDRLPPNEDITPAHTPTAKGKVERVGATIQAEVITGQPGQVTRSKRPNGDHLLAIASEDLLTYEQVVERIQAAVYAYNYEKGHSSLGGRTPFEVYSNNTPIRRPDDAELATLMTESPRV